MPASDTKNKPPSTNTFFSKTKDKFVTAVNKLVDNYGNIPKKQTNNNQLQQKLSNGSNNDRTNPTSSNEQKPSSAKRPAPLAEHILRQQEESRSNINQTSDVTYENTKVTLPTPIPRRITPSTTNTPTKTSVIFAH